MNYSAERYDALQLGLSAVSTTSTVIEINLKDRTFKQLAAFANRVSMLLGRAPVRRSPHALATLDDLLGVIYALVLAKREGYVDRTKRPIQISAVQTRANQIGSGQVRVDGKWMAGFHFNSALFRLAAVYHRALLIVDGRTSSGRKAYVQTVRTEAKALYQKWKNADWSHQHCDTVHDEVIGLKHVPKGVYFGRKAKYDHAVASVGELLNLLEAWVES
jgi:hypothetical protein